MQENNGIREELSERISRLCQELSQEVGPDGQGFSVGLIMVGDSTEVDDTLYQMWQDYCAARLSFESHSFTELIPWLSESYDLESFVAEPGNTHTKLFALNVRGYLESLAPELPATPATEFERRSPEELDSLTDDELKALLTEYYEVHLKDRPHPFDFDVSALNLDIKAWRFPQTARNQPLYEEYLAEQRADAERIRRDRPDLAESMREGFEEQLSDTFLELFWETKSGYWQLQAPFDYQAVLHQIRRYLGLTAEEIDSRSIRFLSYITDEAFAGNLPMFAEFAQDPNLYLSNPQ